MKGFDFPPEECVLCHRLANIRRIDGERRLNVDCAQCGRYTITVDLDKRLRAVPAGFDRAGRVARVKAANARGNRCDVDNYAETALERQHIEPISIRPLTRDDLPLIHELNLDPDVVEYLGGVGLATPGFRYAIVVGHRPIGIAALVHSRGHTGREFELVTAVLDTHRGLGYGPAGCQQVLDLKLAELGDASIAVHVASENAPGKRVAARLGFAPTGEMTESQFYGRQEVWRHA
ncbi:MAG: GNAT family N-acetyltransferase [bacterium]